LEKKICIFFSLKRFFVVEGIFVCFLTVCLSLSLFVFLFVILFCFVRPLSRAVWEFSKNSNDALQTTAKIDPWHFKWRSKTVVRNFLFCKPLIQKRYWWTPKMIAWTTFGPLIPNLLFNFVTFMDPFDPLYGPTWWSMNPGINLWLWESM